MRDPDELRGQLLMAFLPQVAFDGWSKASLEAARKDLGLTEAELAHALPAGLAELTSVFAAKADAAMLAALTTAAPTLKLRERVALAVRARLEWQEPYREAVRRKLAFFAQPLHTALGVKQLAQTADSLWIALCDKSTDHNYYSKRLLLGAVISSTTLYWLNDESDGRAKTWEFLSRRIDNVIKTGGTVGKGMTSLLNLPDRLAARWGGRRR